MKRVVALILAGGQGDRLSVLSEERAKPAVIFGGRYRIIDFALSNIINSGITRVGVLTQYRPRSLNDHIGIGRPWDLDRTGGGITLLQPYLGRASSDWYSGTADAIFQNLYFLEETRAEIVLILAGDHVYKMNYDELIAYHVAKGADVTVPLYKVPVDEAHRYGVLTTDDDNRIVEFEEKPDHPRSCTPGRSRGSDREGHRRPSRSPACRRRAGTGRCRPATTWPVAAPALRGAHATSRSGGRATGPRPRCGSCQCPCAPLGSYMTHQEMPALVIWNDLSTSRSSITVMEGGSYAGRAFWDDGSLESCGMDAPRAGGKWKVIYCAATTKRSALNSWSAPRTSLSATASLTPAKLPHTAAASCSAVQGAASRSQRNAAVPLSMQNVLVAGSNRIVSSCIGAASIAGLR